MILRKALLMGAATATIAASPASAATLVLDGGWTQFNFGNVGSSWSDSFDFTLAGTAELQVTDAFLSGDRFEVFINSISQGLTSAPTSLGDQAQADFDLAFSDAKWSSGSFLLGPGSYTVTGTTVLSPFGGGGAGIQLISAQGAVPEPATWALMILGLGTIGFAMRRRTTTRVSCNFA